VDNDEDPIATTPVKEVMVDFGSKRTLTFKKRGSRRPRVL